MHLRPSTALVWNDPQGAIDRGKQLETALGHYTCFLGHHPAPAWLVERSFEAKRRARLQGLGAVRSDDGPFVNRDADRVTDVLSLIGGQAVRLYRSNAVMEDLSLIHI